ncbi:MAG: adenosylcobalamin-dependent ribonucleoside-diphosphate reductase [Odoribacteraceae bacterium]|jgi:ribonucleoside-diphosphate reductase alpha chain|nr:adenosylcobalamin-dependent ribonucleoside-diphosphate reductase [Odoribacteraceae bacterium]
MEEATIQENRKTIGGKPVYTQEEAFGSTLAYFEGDKLAAQVWVSKYALKDSYGNIFERNPNDMHRRLASEIARVERNYKNPLSEEQIFELLKDFKYIVPQGGPMTGIGNEFQIASLSNCFVIGHEGASDSYGGVMKIDQEQVQLMKRRGGVGHDLSHIRPKGSPVKNSALTSTGIVPFMERYSNSTREVAQDGRRGALMLSVSINHPDSESFIDAKMTEGKVTGANISVKIDDDFMNAAINGQEYVQKYPAYSPDPKNEKRVKAAELWNKIVHNAWQSAEPGILFWDTIIRESVPDCYADLGYRTVSTNPCGEIPLCPYDSCRLLAINLYSYVNDPFSADAAFDHALFDRHVRMAQRIMDDIIDLELEKIDAILDKIEQDPEDDEIKGVETRLWRRIKCKAKEGRRTGVGITGEGDMLAALGLRYGSDDAIEFSVDMHKRLAVAAYGASVDLAIDRGPFSIHDPEREKNNPFIARLKEADPEMHERMTRHGRRNIACLTIAPTGSVSIMTRTTSGIEPVFKPFYTRRRKVNPNDKNVRVAFTDETGDSYEEFHLLHPKLITWMKKNGHDPRRVYSDDELKELVKQSPYHLATSTDIDWLAKVRMQGRVQQWVDHSISVTVNLPADATEELVGQLYVEAWKSGCKGCTVYRDGSRKGVLVSATEKEKVMPLKRPRELAAEVVRFQNNREKWIAFIGLFEGQPYEIFTGIADDDEGIMLPKSVSDGKIVKNTNEEGVSRYDFQFSNKRGFKTTVEGLSYKFNKEFWNYAKFISGVLRYGMPIPQVIELIAAMEFDNENINTWKNGVERALRKFVPNGTELSNGEPCENCGSTTFIYNEGCMACKNCGTSKCE